MNPEYSMELHVFMRNDKRLDAYISSSAWIDAGGAEVIPL